MDNLPDDVHVDWPNSVNGHGVLYRSLVVADEVRPLVNEAYSTAIRGRSAFTQAVVALRTVLEATWLPTYVSPPPVESAWTFWAGTPTLDGAWLLSRRLVKVGVALLTLLVALAICFGQKTRPRHLVAGLLVAVSGSLLASADGAVTNLVWLLPVVLALWALHEVPESKVDAPGAGQFTDTADLSGEGGVPRISVDD
jgi:hypothetical protein